MKPVFQLLASALLSAALGYALAGTWIDGSGDGTDREEASSRISALGRSSPNHSIPKFAQDRINEIWNEPTATAQASAAVHKWSKITDPGKIKTLLNLISELPANQCQSAATAVLLRNWMAEDPVSACRWSETFNHQWLPRCLEDWAAKDPDAALEYAKISNDPDNALGTVLATLSESDPERAFTDLMTLGLYPQSNVLLNYVKSIGPAEAIQKAESLNGKSTSRLSTELRNSALKEWAKQSPTEAIEWWWDAKDRESSVDYLFDHLPAASWEGAMQSVLTLPEGVREQIVNSVAYSWATADAVATYEVFAQNGLLESLPKYGLNNLVRHMAGEDIRNAAAAFEWQDKNSISLAKDIEEKLRLESPSEADQWLADLTDEQRESIDRLKVEREARTPPPATIDAFIVQSLDRGDFNWDQFGHFDRSERDQFIERLAEFESEKVSALSDVIEYMADEHPLMGAELLTLFPPGTVKNSEMKEGTAEIAAHWARQTPREAAAWAARLPEGDLRAIAAQNIVRQWSFFDGEAAKNWANSLPDEASRAAALKGFEDL